MATYGSASNPITTLSGVDFADATNTVYVYIGQATSFTNCSVDGRPVVSVDVQTNVSNVSLTAGVVFSLGFTATASSGAVGVRAMPPILITFNLIGVQPTPSSDIEGSGTQADPYTRITGVGFEWLDSHTYTIYVAIGAVIDIRDDSFDLYSTDPPYSEYGLSYDYSLGYYALHGTVTANNNDSLLIELHSIDFDETWVSNELVFVSPGPTLYIKLPGSSGRTISGSYDCQGLGQSTYTFPSSFQCNVGDTLDLTIDCECGGGITYTWSPSAPAGIRIDNATSAYPFYVRGTFQTAGTYTLHTDCSEGGCVNIATFTVSNGGGWVEGKPFVKVNGAWKEAKKVYVKVNGAWKESK